MNVTASFRRLAPPGEAFHVASAIVGLLGAAMAWAWLALRDTAPATTWAAHAFGFSLCALFLATTLHHARPRSALLARADHAAVFLALAGGAAPICERFLPLRVAILCWSGVALFALAGATLKLAGASLPPRANILAHLALLVPMAPVSWAVPRAGVSALALFAGAVGALVAGAALDARERPVWGLDAHAALHVLAILACAAGFALVAF